MFSQSKICIEPAVLFSFSQSGKLYTSPLHHSGNMNKPTRGYTHQNDSISGFTVLLLQIFLLRVILSHHRLYHIYHASANAMARWLDLSPIKRGIALFDLAIYTDNANTPQRLLYIGHKYVHIVYMSVCRTLAVSVLWLVTFWRVLMIKMNSVGS